MIIKHVTYKCDICGKETENNCITHSLKICTYHNKELDQYKFIQEYDMCLECKDMLNNFIRNIKNNTNNDILEDK